MDKSVAKHRHICGFDPAHLSDFFRRRHPSKTAAHVAGAIGMPERTVERWLTGDTTPRADGLVRIFAVYGAAALAACFPVGRVPQWVDVTARQERRAAIAADIHSLQALLSAGDDVGSGLA